MFDLDHAVLEWRRHLTTGTSLSADTINELESHLRDAVEQKQRGGILVEQAFTEAIAELGEPTALEKQFTIANPPRSSLFLKTTFAVSITGALVSSLVAVPTAQKLIAFVSALILFGAFLKLTVAIRSSSLEPDLSDFSPSALLALERAQAEAPLLNHNFVGTEHLLLGLTYQIPELFQRLGMHREQISVEIQKLVGIGSEVTPPRSISFTPRAKQALHLASMEARRFEHRATSPEHLLLGLLLEPHGAASLVLNNLGIRIDTAREEVLKDLAAQ